MRMLKQTGWGGAITFVTDDNVVKFIVSNTATVDFVKVGDTVSGSFTVLANQRTFRRKYPEYYLWEDLEKTWL